MATPYLGEIRLICTGVAPKGWALCNGAVMSVTSNQALFSLLGTAFGGNGSTTFNLPNLQGAAPMGSGTLGGTSTVYVTGQTGGEANHTLSTAEMPSHNHTLSAVAAAADSGATGTKPSPSVALAQATTGTTSPTPVDIYGTGPASTTLAGDAVGPFGSGQGHSNMQPYLALNFYIATSGYYPTRS